jgi:muramoyltetrapeptide carboxypeptidase
MAEPDQVPAQLTKYVSGKARGRLVGGNLNTLVSLLGTPYEPDFQGKLLFWETFGQDTYAFRFMVHLWLAGCLQQVSEIIFGQFEACEDIGFSLHDILSERVKALNIPALYGLQFGQLDEMTTLPIGGEAELDVDAGTLTLLKPAVL